MIRQQNGTLKTTDWCYIAKNKFARLPTKTHASCLLSIVR